MGTPPPRVGLPAASAGDWPGAGPCGDGGVPGAGAGHVVEPRVGDVFGEMGIAGKEGSKTDAAAESPWESAPGPSAPGIKSSWNVPP